MPLATASAMTIPRPIHGWLSTALIVVFVCSSASAEWKEKVLYSFQGGNDGFDPGGGVVFDEQGNLYGVTQGGGPPNCAPIGNFCGTAYQLTPPVKKGGSWIKTLIYMFKGKGENDGEAPDGLIIDQAGNLYGVTAYGGTGGCVLLGVPAGCGTVYELSPPKTKGGKWTYKILYSFQSGKDGYLPGGNLVFDQSGNLYGTTSFGGGKGTTCNGYYGGNCGTVFELSPPMQKGGQWTEKVLHSFAGGTDGANPNGNLALDSKGDVFGTTFIGGFRCPGFEKVGCGTVFALSPPTGNNNKWTEDILHRFTRSKDGGSPSHGVIFDAKGALYGTTGLGGTQDSGVVFRFTQRSGRWSETILHNLQGTKDESNVTGLVFDSLGNLYCASGAILRLKPPRQQGGKWVLSVLYEFGVPPDGRSPLALTFGMASVLYGTTEWGGTGQSCQGGCGTVFEVSP